MRFLFIDFIGEQLAEIIDLPGGFIWLILLMVLFARFIYKLLK